METVPFKRADEAVVDDGTGIEYRGKRAEVRTTDGMRRRAGTAKERARRGEARV